MFFQTLQQFMEVCFRWNDYPLQQNSPCFIYFNCVVGFASKTTKFSKNFKKSASVTSSGEFNVGNLLLSCPLFQYFPCFKEWFFAFSRERRCCVTPTESMEKWKCSGSMRSKVSSNLMNRNKFSDFPAPNSIHNSCNEDICWNTEIAIATTSLSTVLIKFLG